MDSLSQFVLGAAVGEACLGKKLGFKASVWGGLAATIPDLDFIIGNRLGVLQEITFHRGPSHSIFFALALTPILTFIALKMHKKKHSDLKFWDFSPLFFLALFTHSLLDCFTTWGTQLFWPFNLNRVALASISVVDPFYTFPLILCWFFALFCRKKPNRHRKFIFTGLIISSLYLMLTLFNQNNAKKIFMSSLEQKNIQFSELRVRPTIFNNFLWTATVKTEESFFIGLYSFLDKNKIIEFKEFKKKHFLLGQFGNNKDVKTLVSLSRGFFTLKSHQKGVVFNDLRFGQLAPWKKQASPFVFSYLLRFPDLSSTERVKVIKLSTKFEDAKKELMPFFHRILGNK